MRDAINIKCNMCGGSALPLHHNPRYYKCEYCGAVSTAITARETVQLERAFCKLRDGDFDDAEEDFDNILNADSSAYEASWGKLLAQRGIIYVNDPSSDKRVPTLNKIGGKSLLADRCYISAIKHAPTEVGLSYADAAKQIDTILAKQRAIVTSEQPYDIFLCYKESDGASGIDRTKDSYECSDLYVRLTSLGYRVFYARESLRSHIAEDYEPYIYNALMTAKVMIVYATCPEYIKATWVRNEWSRYEKLITGGKKSPSSLVLAVSGMDAGEAPQSFAKRQALDATSRTFYIDLERHIAAVIGGKKSSVASINAVGSRCLSCGGSVPAASVYCPSCGAIQESHAMQMLRNLPPMEGEISGARTSEREKIRTAEVDPFSSSGKKSNRQVTKGTQTKSADIISIVAFFMLMVIIPSLIVLNFLYQGVTIPDSLFYVAIGVTVIGIGFCSYNINARKKAGKKINLATFMLVVYIFMFLFAVNIYTNAVEYAEEFAANLEDLFG